MPIKLTKREKQALKGAGTAGDISKRINAYTATVAQLSSRREELVGQYPKYWVAWHDDAVVCTGKSLSELFLQCDERNYSRDSIAVRFLDTEKQILIL